MLFFFSFHALEIFCLPHLNENPKINMEVDGVDIFSFYEKSFIIKVI